MYDNSNHMIFYIQKLLFNINFVGVIVFYFNLFLKIHLKFSLVNNS